SGYERAGLFVRDRFLVQPTKLEQVLGKQVFATSVRLLHGDPAEYRDIRITPENLSGPRLVLNYHFHQDVLAKDKGRISQLVQDIYASETPRLNQVLSSL